MTTGDHSDVYKVLKCNSTNEYLALKRKYIKASNADTRKSSMCEIATYVLLI